MKRLVTSMVCFALAGAGMADDLQRARPIIAMGFAGLGESADLTSQYACTVTRNGVEQDYTAFAFLHRTFAPVESVQFELRAYDNNVLTQRIVGDGTRAWNYNPAQNTYSVFYYGDASFSPAYSASLFLFVARQTTGNLANFGALLKQIDQARSGSNTLAGSWTPLLSNAVVTVNSPPNVVNFANATVTASTPNPATMNYAMAYPQTGTPYLQSVSFDGFQLLAGSEQETNWVVISDRLMTGNHDFTFNPGNARAVSINSPQGG